MKSKVLALVDPDGVRCGAECVKAARLVEEIVAFASARKRREVKCLPKLAFKVRLHLAGGGGRVDSSPE